MINDKNQSEFQSDFDFFIYDKKDTSKSDIIARTSVICSSFNETCKSCIGIIG